MGCGTSTSNGALPGDETRIVKPAPNTASPAQEIVEKGVVVSVTTPNSDKAGKGSNAYIVPEQATPKAGVSAPPVLTSSSGSKKENGVQATPATGISAPPAVSTGEEHAKMAPATTSFKKQKLGLANRAAHPMLLMKIADMKIDLNGVNVALGDLTVYEVVEHFIIPATAKSGRSFMEDLHEGNIALPQMKGGTCTGLPSNWRGEQTWSWLSGKSRAMLGPTTFYISYTWSTKFYDLVELLVFQHYRHQSTGENNMVATALPYFPVFYWLDMFAISQHYEGDPRTHPDGPFEDAIKASRAVLLVIGPLSTCPGLHRLWCLYEAMLALHCDVAFELLLTQDVVQAQDLRQAELDFLDAVVIHLDVQNAHVRQEPHRSFILESIAGFKAIDAFNAHMRNLLPARLVEAMLVRTIMDGNVRGAKQLYDAGARITANTLGLAHCKVQGDELVGVLCDGIRTSSSLKYLNLTGAVLGLTGIQLLSTVVAGKLSLNHLDLSSVVMEDEGVKVLAAALGSNRNLRTLSLYRVGMGPAGLSAVADAVRQHPKLETLVLSFNRSLAKAEIALAQLGAAMVECSTLTTLELCACGLTDDCASMLATSLTSNKSLTSLDLSSNEIHNTGLTDLAQALLSNTSLLRLGLDYNELEQEPAATLANSIQAHPALKEVNLLKTGMEEEAVLQMATALRLGAKSMEVLNLSQCHVGNAGAFALAEALPLSPALRVLRLVNCHIETEGVQRLAAAVVNQPQGFELVLTANRGVPKTVWQEVQAMCGERVVV